MSTLCTTDRNSCDITEKQDSQQQASEPAPHDTSLTVKETVDSMRRDLSASILLGVGGAAIVGAAMGAELPKGFRDRAVALALKIGDTGAAPSPAENPAVDKPL